MKRLSASIACVAFVAVVMTAVGGEKTLKVEGTWQVTAGISGGKKVPEDAVKKMQVAIKAGKYSVTRDTEEIEAGTYKVDESKKPAHLDLTITKGEGEGKTQLGILKLEGDNMSVAFGEPGKEFRPKDFEGGPGIEVVLLKRKK
jgi:uncharacterized protein (TIGR03067 family)